MQDPSATGHDCSSDLHAAGEKGLLVKDALVVLHQVVQLVCQLQGQGLQGGRLCAVHHQTGRGLIQGRLKCITKNITYTKKDSKVMSMMQTLLTWQPLGTRSKLEDLNNSKSSFSFTSVQLI